MRPPVEMMLLPTPRQLTCDQRVRMLLLAGYAPASVNPQPMRAMASVMKPWDKLVATVNKDHSAM